MERVSEKLRELTLRDGVEYAAMIDMETAGQLGLVLGGEKSTVNIGEHLDEMIPGRQYIQMHTHPASSSFSTADIELLNWYEGISTMVVTGADGTQYVMMKETGRNVPELYEISEAYQEALKALEPKYTQLIHSGTMSTEEAWKEHSHEIWTRIASRFGFRYIRLLP
jgi:hypothetical protein